MKSILIAAALLAAPIAHAQTTPAPAAAPAAAEQPMVVYDKALGPGWENWSWGKTELSVEGVGARKPMKLEAKAWEAAYLHHAPFSTAPYRSLNLLLQPIGVETEVRIVAIVNGKPIPDGAPVAAGQEPQPKGKLIKIAPGGWKNVQIPLGELGAENATIDGIWVQNATPNQAPNVYIADVAFKP